MRNHTWYSLFILISILTGCKKQASESVIHYTSFPTGKELKAITIELDTAIFRYPFRMQAQGDRVIVMDLHNANHYFHLFTYPEFRYVSSFGKRGDAPDEMLAAENFRFVGDQEVEVWTLDSNKSTITRLGFSTSRDSLLHAKAVALDKNLLRPLDFCIYEDSLMIIPDYSGENRFCFVSPAGKLLYKSGQIPTTNLVALNESKPVLSQAWRSFVDYHPRHGIVAAATQLGEVLEIYNYRDSTHTVLIGPNGEPEFQEMNGYAIPAGIMGFSDVQVTDNYIYTVFHGRKFKDMMKNPDKIVDGGQFIYVFDLKGNPVCKYTLDRFVNGLFVDETTQKIYATDVNSNQPLVYFAL
ncbi:BF3164 family lipoprotein [Bacteroides sp. 51]|uniref:BF3164 family lipoprotein n=1 Tax=Bacteroides sp. 51 TaxID=2302938 RepID=UPI0013D74D3C|nr:BF3164 family lipoprotein [Bacteroides sp. 51]NDV81655.1 hypothetical protein [Bacteroides sp. 51]